MIEITPCYYAILKNNRVRLMCNSPVQDFISSILSQVRLNTERKVKCKDIK